MGILTALNLYKKIFIVECSDSSKSRAQKHSKRYFLASSKSLFKKYQKSTRKIENNFFHTFLFTEVNCFFFSYNHLQFSPKNLRGNYTAYPEIGLVLKSSFKRYQKKLKTYFFHRNVFVH